MAQLVGEHYQIQRTGPFSYGEPIRASVFFHDSVKQKSRDRAITWIGSILFYTMLSKVPSKSPK